MTNSNLPQRIKKLYFTFKSCSKLCSFQISYNITFINYSSLLGANFYNASRKISKDLFILSPRSGNITEHFIMLVFPSDKRCHRRTFHGNFPLNLSLIRRNNRISLSTLIFSNCFLIKATFYHSRILSTL